VEGLGNGYCEKEIYVPGYGACFVYVAQQTHIDVSLKPFGWYKQLVIHGCVYHQFPAEYVETIRQIPHVDDPDSCRHDKWMDLVKKMQQQV